MARGAVEKKKPARGKRVLPAARKKREGREQAIDKKKA